MEKNQNDRKTEEGNSLEMSILEESETPDSENSPHGKGNRWLPPYVNSSNVTNYCIFCIRFAAILFVTCMMFIFTKKNIDELADCMKSYIEFDASELYSLVTSSFYNQEQYTPLLMENYSQYNSSYPPPRLSIPFKKD